MRFIKVLLLLNYACLLPTSRAFSWFSTGTLSNSIVSSSTSSSSSMIPEKCRILILPGFGNDSVDYFLEQAPQGSLVQSLQKRGWKEEQIHVLPVTRSDWLQVFWKGALDWEFWKGSAAPTRPAYNWYLSQVAESIREITETDESSRVVLIGHSAGGWLGRAVCGFGSTDGSETPYSIDLNKILGVVTLGAPHLPPPPQVMDMTRGALRITNEIFPGAYHNSLFYITVAGAAIQGIKQKRESPLERTTPSGYAYNSYEVVCGTGESVGDGVVPVCAAHLEDATQLTLDKVFHSINVPDRWYGSDSVVDSWHDAMIKALRKNKPPSLQERVPIANFLDSLFASRN